MYTITHSSVYKCSVNTKTNVILLTDTKDKLMDMMVRIKTISLRVKSGLKCEYNLKFIYNQYTMSYQSIYLIMQIIKIAYIQFVFKWP